MHKNILLFLKAFTFTLFFSFSIGVGAVAIWFVSDAFAENPTWIIPALPFLIIGGCGLGGFFTLCVNPSEIFHELEEDFEE